MPDNSEGFYEDDEPVEDVVAAFESGERGVASPPLTFCFVTESLNTGLVAYTPLDTQWVTANSEMAGQNTGSAVSLPA